MCSYCGHRAEVAALEATIDEEDLASALIATESAGHAAEVTAQVRYASCEDCGAEVDFGETTTATRCPFCDSPVVMLEEAVRLIAPSALLPFAIPEPQAKQAFKQWVSSHPMSPMDFKRSATVEAMSGVYLPFWTFDCRTFTKYRGQKRTRTGKRTVWSPVSGVSALDIDDLLVSGTTTLDPDLAQKLEPWDLGALVPCQADYLAGFGAERYHTDLPAALKKAEALIRSRVEQAIREQIGGSAQKIDESVTERASITYKHILLPVWIGVVRYRGRVAQFLVNARTGEVQGTAPVSPVKKMALAAVGAAVVWFLAQRLWPVLLSVIAASPSTGLDFLGDLAAIALYWLTALSLFLYAIWVTLRSFAEAVSGTISEWLRLRRTDKDRRSR